MNWESSPRFRQVSVTGKSVIDTIQSIVSGASKGSATGRVLEKPLKQTNTAFKLNIVISDVKKRINFE